MRGLDISCIDESVRPGDDFYKYVNGGWLIKTEIPEDRSSWGSFHELAKNTDEKIISILEAELDQPGPAENKAARLFESGMHTASINSQKLNAVSEYLENIKSIKNHKEIYAILGQLNKAGLPAIIHLSVHPDLADSKKYSAYIEPAPFGLPDREFYFDEDEKAASIRNKYSNYIASLLEDELAYSKEDAKRAAQSILTIETDLAAHTLTKEKRRQIELLYNPHTTQELRSAFPTFQWDDFFYASGVEKIQNGIVTEPGFVTYLDNSIEKIDLSKLTEYLLFLVIHHAAPYVHNTLEEKHFDLYFRTLEGVDKMRPRNERILKVVNHYLGEALGELFVSKYFPPHAKAAALEMVDDIVTAFQNRIQRLSWMSEKTKAYALEKLAGFRVKIGYPDKWKDYDDLHLNPSDENGSYLENLLATVQWKFDRDIKRIDQEVDREEWFMPPQIVNAYYNPMFNEIVFPAAILQPPFFDWEADAAINYGGIGAVIGHEITHGFDDQGSRFDKNGNLNEWWSQEDRERFTELTNQLVSQFDQYYPFEDLPLNGTFTLGENIADLGGLSVAFDALKLYHERHGKPGLIDGYTPEQRFFMSWATVWRMKTRPEALRNQIKTDPHPPAMYRAVAAPSNLDDFYDAFEIASDSPWYRSGSQRIKIW